jgi:hypothetical protein
MKYLKDRMMEQLLPLVPHLEIAHHVNGRVRLKVLPSGLRAVQGIDIKALLAAIRGVLKIRVNTLARSVVIDYDHHQIPFDFWPQLAQLKFKPELLNEVTDQLQRLWRD